MEFGNLANSITLSSSQPGSRDGSRAGLRPALAKIHYAIKVEDLVTDLVSDLSQTGSNHGRRPVQAIYHYAILLATRLWTSSLSSLRCDQQASWSQPQAAERNGIWSLTGLRPASELDSVMEFSFRDKKYFKRMLLLCTCEHATRFIHLRVNQNEHFLRRACTLRKPKTKNGQYNEATNIRVNNIAVYITVQCENFMSTLPRV